MAVENFFEKEGRKYCEIIVAVRSEESRAIKVQRQDTIEVTGLSEEELRKRIDTVVVKLQNKAQKSVYQRELEGSSWSHVLGEWKAALEAGEGHVTGTAVKQSTWKGYIQALNDFTDGWMNKPACEITPADVVTVLAKMEREGYSDCRRYNVRVAINLCFKWGIMKRLIKGVLLSPAHGLSVSRKSSKRPEGLNHSQLVFLLEEAYRRNHPWRQIWAYVLYTGARSGEAYEARAKDVERQELRLYFERKYNFADKAVEDLKDAEWRQVPINEEFNELLTELGLESKGPEDYLLPRIRAWTNNEQARILRAFCDEIGIPSICFHTLRAMWATQLLQNKVSPRKVMEMGGWSDPETMERYIRRAGIEIAGATDTLRFRRKERPARVLKLVHRKAPVAVDDGDQPGASPEGTSDGKAQVAALVAATQAQVVPIRTDAG